MTSAIRNKEDNFTMGLYPMIGAIGRAVRVFASRPRAFTVLSSAFTFLNGLALLKIANIFSPKNPKKTFPKVSQPKPAAVAEPEIKLAPASPITKKGIRMWAERREQLLKAK